MARVTLSNTAILSGSAIPLLESTFSYAMNLEAQADPGNGFFGLQEAQFNGWENPLISLTFHIPIDHPVPGTMTWALWNQFAKNQYDGTSATKTTLSIIAGTSSTAFLSYAASSSNTGTSSIGLQIKDFTLTFAANESLHGGFWNINARCIETK